jgi:hypothetical protein
MIKFMEYMLSLGLKVGRHSISGRAVFERATVHAHDVLADPEFTLFDAQKLDTFAPPLASTAGRQPDRYILSGANHG